MASMAFLKKKAKGKKGPKVKTAGVSLSPDEIDAMSGKQMDEYVAAHKLALKSWDTMLVPGKNKALKKHFKRVTLEAATKAAGTAAEQIAAKKKVRKKKVAPGHKGLPGVKMAKVTKKGTGGLVHQPEAEYLPADPISDLEVELGKMTEDEALVKAREDIQNTEYRHFHLGGVLAKIQDEEWFGEYDNFRDWMENTLEFGWRKGMYFVAIYRTLKSAGVPWSKVQQIGWTKLKELLPVISAGEDVDKWTKKAQGMNTLQLIEAVRAATKADGKKKDKDAPESPTVGTLTFKLHDDQREVIDDALKKAMDDISTEFKAVALTAICQDFLSVPGVGLNGELDVSDGGIKSFLEAMGVQGDIKGKDVVKKFFAVFEKMYPDVQVEVNIAG